MRLVFFARYVVSVNRVVALNQHLNFLIFCLYYLLNHLMMLLLWTSPCKLYVDDFKSYNSDFLQFKVNVRLSVFICLSVFQNVCSKFKLCLDKKDNLSWASEKHEDSCVLLHDIVAHGICQCANYFVFVSVQTDTCFHLLAHQKLSDLKIVWYVYISHLSKG